MSSSADDHVPREVGVLVFIRPPRVFDAAVREKIATAVGPLGGRAILCVDLREMRVLTVAQVAMVREAKRLPCRRQAFLVSPTAPLRAMRAHLSFESDTHRVFDDVEPLFHWLSGVTTPHQVAQLRAFITPTARGTWPRPPPRST
jgi:hypothetical protein